MAEGIVLNDSYYDVYDGAIYFNSTLENIISQYYEDWEEELGVEYADELISNTIYYNLHITFKLAVPDTTEETSMWALSQAIHYSIMDYFNQYEYARATANMVSEIGYTTCMTFWSTAISVPFTYLGSHLVTSQFSLLGTAGAMSAKAMIGELLVKLFTSPIKEIFQELVADSITETLVQFAVEELGGTEDLGFWLSSLATSLRESTAGPLANIAFSSMTSGFKSSTSLKKASGTFSMLKGLMSGNRDLTMEGYVTFEEARAQEAKSQLQKEITQSGWRKLLSSGVLKGIALASASLITGGVGFFTLMGMARSLDSSVEHYLAPSTQELALRYLCRTNQIMAMKQILNPSDAYLSMEGESGLFLGKQSAKLEEFGATFNEYFQDQQDHGKTSMETVETLPTFRFKLTGTPPDQAIHKIKLDLSKDLHEIKKDAAKKLKLNPILNYKFIVNEKMLESIAQLKETYSNGGTITFIGEQAGGRPATTSDYYKIRSKLNDELNMVKQARDEMKNKPKDQKKRILEEIFRVIDDADNDKSYLMREYERETGDVAFSTIGRYAYRPNNNYLNWLKSKFDTIDNKLKLEERRLKFATSEITKANLERYGEFAEMIEGDKYEILVSQREQTFQGFLEENNLVKLKKFNQRFKFFKDGMEISDYIGTNIDFGDEILIIPIISDDKSLSPQFIDKVMNPILGKIYEKKLDLLKENERKLIRLWWSTALGSLYEDSVFRDDGSSPYAPHLDFLEDILVKFCYRNNIISSPKLGKLRSFLKYDIKNGVLDLRAGRNFKPGVNCFARIYSQIEIELREKNNKAALKELKILFSQIYTIFGHKENIIRQELRHIYHKWATLISQIEDSAENNLINTNTIKQLDTLIEADFTSQLVRHSEPDYFVFLEKANDLKKSLQSFSKKGFIDLDRVIDEIEQDIDYFRLLYQNSIFSLIKERFGEIKNWKRILLEDIGKIILEELDEKVGIELINYLVLSDFLFYDREYMKAKFLSDKGLKNRPYHTTIFKIIYGIESRDYNGFIDIFDILIQDFIREGISEKSYKILKDKILNYINKWFSKNYYEKPYIATKTSNQIRKYGNDIGKKELEVLYNIWQFLFKFYGFEDFTSIQHKI
ncbi:MAG: hypothetical protein EU548_08380, partial [Promethearchaeota archaeon]